MARFHQLLLVATFLPMCWFAMMAVHELGHIVGASLTGGTVTKVVLHPFTISRTDVSPNPQPLAVAWAGPMVGVLVPLVLLAVFRLANVRWCYLAQFFAGFCLIANKLAFASSTSDSCATPAFHLFWVSVRIVVTSLACSSSTAIRSSGFSATSSFA